MPTPTPSFPNSYFPPPPPLFLPLSPIPPHYPLTTPFITPSHPIPSLPISSLTSLYASSPWFLFMTYRGGLGKYSDVLPAASAADPSANERSLGHNRARRPRCGIEAASQAVRPHHPARRIRKGRRPRLERIVGSTRIRCLQRSYNSTSLMQFFARGSEHPAAYCGSADLQIGGVGGAFDENLAGGCVDH